MKFIERMERLIKADAHGVLEKLEERSLLLKQHLREAELEIDRKRAAQELLDEEHRHLDDQACRIRDELKALDEDVELALSGGKEDLARFAVRRLLAKREAKVQIEARSEEIAQRRERLGERLALQTRQIEELRVRVRAELAAARIAEEQGTPEWAQGCAAEEEIDLEILRRKQAAESGNEEGLR